MKKSPTPFLQLLSFLLFVGFTVNIQAQGVHPQNLFDTGLNQGYLNGHHSKEANPTDATIWAGNASAEWLESWEPGAVLPVTPSIEDPSISHEDMIRQSQVPFRIMAQPP